MSVQETSKLQLLPGSQCLEGMRALADCIYEGVCAIDTKGLVIIWNRSAEKLYDIPARKILGRPLQEYFPDALLDKVRKSRVGEFNVSHHPKDKKSTHIVISAMPWYIDGVFQGVISTDRNYDEVMNLYADLEDARAKVTFLQGQIKKQSGVFGTIIGNNKDFSRKVNHAIQIAPTDASVILTGESGTGKELFARGIHELSGREGLFVPINCSAIPSELFESEFFGYTPGAFTGASRRGKAGFFELANSGTIFLDEISEMPINAQAKLLRVLQEREVLRVGGAKPVKLNVRVIAASNRNLKEMMQRGLFREDLYYRLSVIDINLPPLRERKEDIPLLIQHFVQDFCQKNGQATKSVQTEVINMLCAYSWPGNMRELMNVIENLAITCKGDTITKKTMPSYIIAAINNDSPNREEQRESLSSAVRFMESSRILNALEACRNNKSKAARMLGIPRASLYNKMEEYGIEK
ncbi:sigma 54-interacting transcriptional regulator [Desulfovibrio sp. OttesenSCG-928-G15]|nr:sigma 54-interacting transcriptional regulator [Desulfovibrio sp. OttesenSCG-928-G15]